MRRLPFEYAVRNLGRSPMRLSLAFAGALLVSALATSAAALLAGLDRALGVSEGRENAILLGAGSEESLERSEVSPAVASIVSASVPGIPSVAGVPLASPEALMAVPIRLDDRSAPRQALLRGVEPVALLVHSGVRVVEGRVPETGRDDGVSEAMIGPRCERQLGVAPGSLGVGARFVVDATTFEVVGRFEAPGSVMEPEIWAPLTDVLAATKRTTISCVVVAIDPGGGASAASSTPGVPDASDGGATFEDLAAFAARRLDLELVVLTEAEYFASLQRFFAPLRWMIVLSAGLVALGALLGGLNTLHAAFASRSREVGTLQALGYGRGAVLLSFAQESLLLACAAAACAVLLCRWLLDGVGIAFSMGTFAFRVDAAAVAIGLLAGLGLALLGAVVSAMATLRRPIPQALRAP